MAKVRFPTDAEIAAARERGRREHQFDGRRLTYRPALDILEIELFNGLRVSIPRCMIDEIADLPVSVAKEMRLGVQGEAIEIRSLDIDISVPGLLRDLVGANISSLGGQAKSPAKAAAARANGQLGGRPRKRATTKP